MSDRRIGPSMVTYCVEPTAVTAEDCISMTMGDLENRMVHLNSRRPIDLGSGVQHVLRGMVIHLLTPIMASQNV